MREHQCLVLRHGTMKIVQSITNTAPIGPSVKRQQITQASRSFRTAQEKLSDLLSQLPTGVEVVCIGLLFSPSAY